MVRGSHARRKPAHPRLPPHPTPLAHLPPRPRPLLHSLVRAPLRYIHHPPTHPPPPRRLPILRLFPHRPPRRKPLPRVRHRSPKHVTTRQHRALHFPDHGTQARQLGVAEAAQVARSRRDGLPPRNVVPLLGVHNVRWLWRLDIIWWAKTEHRALAGFFRVLELASFLDTW